MENSIDHIITRILSGNSSSEDFLSLSEWLNADEKNKKEFRLLKSYWDAEVSFSHSLMPNVSLDNLRKKIDDQSRQKRLRLIRFIATPIAAAIAFLVLFFATIHLNTREAKVQQFYTYITDKNKSHFTLDDGTKIILNRNSRFTYSDAYGTDQRKVNLEGEAYFNVTKDSLKPFRITMGNSTITVLGTSFNLKNEIKSSSITATLIEGSICFETPEQKVLLKPGQQLSFNQQSNSLDIAHVDTEESISWKSELLRYKSIPFTELIQELEDKYQTRIIIKNKKLMKHDIIISGSFSKKQSIEQILKVISQSLPFNWTYDNGIYYIQ